MKSNIVERVKTHTNLIVQQSLPIYIKGVFRWFYYKKLQKRFNFDNWHVVPYEVRPYAWFLVNYINRNINVKSVVEIGCGLGDIIRNIKAEYKVGIDQSEEVLNCAEFLGKNSVCKFKLGELGGMVNLPEKLDLLITVNFIHNIPDDDLRKSYAEILKNTKIENIIVDSKGGEYRYHHINWMEIIPGYSVKVIWNYGDTTLYWLEHRKNV